MSRLVIISIATLGTAALDLAFVETVFSKDASAAPRKARPGKAKGPKDGAPPKKQVEDSRPGKDPKEDGRKAVKPYLVAVLPSVSKPEAAADLDKKFRSSIESGITKSGQMVVSSSRVDLVQARYPLLDQCVGGECARKVASDLKAELLCRLKLLRTGNNFELTLSLIDPRGLLSYSSKERCDICTLKEALATASRMGAELGAFLLEKPRPEPPRPRPSEPKRCAKNTDCASGQVCEKSVCVSPRQCKTGSDCRKDEVCHQQICMDARKVPKPRPVVKVVPRPKPKPRPVVKIKVKVRHPPFRRKLTWGTWAVVTSAAAVPLIIVGASLLAVDGKYTCDRSRPEINCPYRYKTRAAGGTLLAFGAASAAASAFFGYMWLRARSKKKKKARKAAVSFHPLQRGAAASFGLRF